jgi:hypothetical protein
VAALAALALSALLTPPAAPAAETEVYPFTLIYRGTCSNDLRSGELRFTGDVVELYGDGPRGREFVASGTSFPDGRFEVDVPNGFFHIGGRRENGTVSADGNLGSLGSSSCLFRLTGSLLAPGAPAPGATTSTTTLESEEFNPAADGPLSRGEIQGLLERVEVDRAQIDAIFQQGQGSGAPAADEATRALRYVRLLGAMTDVVDDGRREFSTLHALSADNGPLARLAPALINGPPEAAVAFHRLVRLAITLDL